VNSLKGQLQVAAGARFFLVAGLMKWDGVRMETVLHRYVDGLG
jgi:hypothetical protein